jgi:hypothetical protein
MTSNSPDHDGPSVPGRRPTSGEPLRTGGSDGRLSPDSARSSAVDGPAPTSAPRGADKARASAAEATEATKAGQGTPGKKAGTARTSGKKASGGDWNVFRTVVVLVGLVIAGFGAYYLILGTAGLPDTEGTPVNPTLESQFRFFSAMMVGVGAAFITIAIKFQWANMLWLVCLMVFVGGIGRVLSWAFSGTPNYIMIVLMVVELAFPPALLVWHKYIAKTSQMRQEFAQRG